MAITRDTTNILLKQFNGDLGGIGPALIRTGYVPISTTMKKFGTGALYFDGQYYSDASNTILNRIYIPQSPVTTFANNNFTISFWEYMVSAPKLYSCAMAFNLGTTAHGIFWGSAQTTSTRNLYMSSNGTSWDMASGISLGTIVLGAWVHWELSRNGNTFYVFKNGALQASFTSSLSMFYSINGSSANVIGSILGQVGDTTTQQAYYDELYINNGTCLHTSAFTPPTVPFDIDTTPVDLPGNPIDLINIGQRSISTNTSINIFPQSAIRNSNVFTGRNIESFKNGSKRIIGRSGKNLNIEQLGIRDLRMYYGENLSVIKYGNRNTSYNNSVNLEFLQTDDTANYYTNFLVTPTFTYDNSAINIHVVNKKYLIGKYRLSANGNILIPYSSNNIDISDIRISLELSALIPGDNNCLLEFLDANNSKGILRFLVTNETLKRIKSSRSFKSYTGGYSCSNVRFGLSSVTNKEGFILDMSSNSGIVTTTDMTSINLEKMSSISSVTINSNGARFLVSFDNRQTWQAFNGVWSLCSEDNISTQGMSRAVVQAITADQWKQIFRKTQLDFKAYLSDSLEALSESLLSSISTSSDSTYYVPSDVVVTKVITTCSSGSAGIIIYDRSGNILFSTSNTVTYIVPAGISVGTIYTWRNLVWVGSSALIYGGYGYSYLGNVDVNFPLNMPPVITNVTLSISTLHSGESILSATLDDPNQDEIQYRVRINGDDITPWTEFLSVPQVIETTITAETCSVGTNSIQIEVTDRDRTTTYETFITRTNDNPTVSGILNKNVLTALIGDAENDAVRYRLLLNGIVQKDWSDFMPSPSTVSYTIKNGIIVGIQNTLRVEVEDSLGGQGSCNFDFVGKQYNKKYAFIM